MPKTLKSVNGIKNHLFVSETYLNNYPYNINNKNSVYLSLYRSSNNESLLIYHNQLFVENYVSNSFVNNLDYISNYSSNNNIFSGKCKFF